jgi:hypothetical protein
MLEPLKLEAGQEVPYVSGRKIAIGIVVAAAPVLHNMGGYKRGANTAKPNYSDIKWKIRRTVKRRPGEADVIEVMDSAIRKALAIRDKTTQEAV